MCCLICCLDTFFLSWALRCVHGSSEATHVFVVLWCNTPVVAALRREGAWVCACPGSGTCEAEADWASLESATFEVPLRALASTRNNPVEARLGAAPQSAAHCSCVFVPARMCRAHVWVPVTALAAETAGRVHGEAGGAAEVLLSGCAAAAQAALRAAQLPSTQVLSMRVYYRQGCLEQGELEAVLPLTWARVPGWGPGKALAAAFVPVLAVGSTSAVDAAVLVEVYAAQEQCCN